MLDLLTHLFHADHGERTVLLLVADQWSTFTTWANVWARRALTVAARASGVPEDEVADAALSAGTGALCLLFAVAIPAAVAYYLEV